MFRRKLPPPAVSGRDSAEHQELDELQVARQTFQRAVNMSTTADRLLTDATDALTKARRNVRRASERDC